MELLGLWLLSDVMQPLGKSSTTAMHYNICGFGQRAQLALFWVTGQTSALEYDIFSESIGQRC